LNPQTSDSPGLLRSKVPPTPRHIASSGVPNSFAAGISYQISLPLPLRGQLATRAVLLIPLGLPHARFFLNLCADLGNSLADNRINFRAHIGNLLSIIFACGVNCGRP